MDRVAMDNNSADKSPQKLSRDSELLPAILAITLAVASQLALRDGLTLPAILGFIASVWLFVSSVRPLFDEPIPAEESPVEDSPEEVIEARVDDTEGMTKLQYLQRHWRKLTIAQIMAGEFPLAEEVPAAEIIVTLDDPDGMPAADQESEMKNDATADVEPLPADQEDEMAVEAPPDAKPALEAQVTSWTAVDSTSSAPTAVKVTPQGEVIVLDVGLEQVQRFDDQGQLLAVYSLSGLADLDVLDLAVSPDGQTLYIVDAASRRLQVINLTDESSTDPGVD